MGHVTESNSQCRLGNYEMENIKSQGKGISLFPYFLFYLISASAFGLVSSISSNLITTIYFEVQSSPQQTLALSEGSLETEMCAAVTRGFFSSPRAGMEQQRGAEMASVPSAFQTVSSKSTCSFDSQMTSHKNSFSLRS